MKPIETADDIALLLQSAQALAVAAAWQQTGLFEHLRRGPAPIAELPADGRAVRVTIPILKHIGLLVGDQETVALSQAAKRLLDAQALPSTWQLDMLVDATKLPELLQHGGPVKDASGKSKGTHGGVQLDDPKSSAAFLDMLYRRSEQAADQAFAWLHSKLPANKKSRVLDVGGGHGRYGRLFADAGSEVWLFDFPMIIDYAKRRHGKALNYLEGDFNTTEDFQGPYDLIFLSNIVHGEAREHNAQLLRKLAKALHPGGLLVLKDMFIDEHGSNPDIAVFFGLTMLNYTQAGESWPVASAKQWLQDAGLSDVDLVVFERFQLVSGRKLPEASEEG